MGRLIDADAFIEYVNRRFDLCSDELRMMIEEQPTAYDVVLVEDMKEQIGASGEHMDNKLREWIKRLERGGVK